MFYIGLLFFLIGPLDPYLARVNHRLNLFDVVQYEFSDVALQRNRAERHLVQLGLQDLCDHDHICASPVDVYRD